MKKAACLLIALFLAWGTAANAAIIFSNGGIGNNGFISDPSFAPTGGFSADDFILGPGASTITGVQWTGLYGLTNTPQATDIFTIQFFADAAGSPVVTPFLTVPIGTAGRTDTGINTPFGADIFSYSTTIAPLVLAPNTRFWISIINDTTVDTDDNWFWGMQDVAGNSFIRFSAAAPWLPATPGSTNPGNRHDFTLTGPDVPEPSALALLLIGAIGLLGRRRKRES